MVDVEHISISNISPLRLLLDHADFAAGQRLQSALELLLFDARCTKDVREGQRICAASKIRKLSINIRSHHGLILVDHHQVAYPFH